jgi:Arc/MetJ family transcription regulator
VTTVPTSAGSRQHGHATGHPRRRCCRQKRAGGSICPFLAALNYTQAVIFKQVGEGRPYPDHARTTREWADVPPRPVRLDQLITTKAVLDLRLLLDKDSTFYGDLFPHVIQWRGELYLEDGLHRALGAALHQRTVLHARVLNLDTGDQAAPSRRRSGLAAD